MRQRLKVVRPDPRTILLNRSRWVLLLSIIGGTISIIIWYSIVLSIALSAFEKAGGAFVDMSTYIFIFILTLIFLLIPLFGIPRAYRALKRLVVGDRWEFNGNYRRISRNNQKLLDFDEVDKLHIRTTTGESDEHRLTILQSNGNKIEIDQSSDFHEIFALADDIASILGVEVAHEK